MKELLKYMKKQNNIDSIMTLSPLTPVATHYHIRNGAKLIKINPTTQNFLSHLVLINFFFVILENAQLELQ